MEAVKINKHRIGYTDSAISPKPKVDLLPIEETKLDNLHLVPLRGHEVTDKCHFSGEERRYSDAKEELNSFLEPIRAIKQIR